MRKIKICFLNPTLSMGGAEKYLINLIKFLDESKYEIVVMPIIHTGELKDVFKSKNIQYRPILRNILNPNKSIKGSNHILDFIFKIIPQKFIYPFLIREDFDVVISNHGLYCLKIASFCNNSKTKKIAFIHNDYSTLSTSTKLNPFNSFEQLKDCYSSFDFVYSVSKGAREKFLNKLNIDTDLEKYKVLYHLNDYEEIKIKSNFEIKIQKERFTICTVGRLIEDKGVQNVIKAISVLKQKEIDTDLWIIGDGPYRNNLEKLAKEEEIEKNIHFIGFTDNPYKYISKVDILCNASYSESLSIVILEAFILDIPVISTPICSVNELLGESVYGLITEDFSAKAIAEKIELLYQDKGMFNVYKERIKNWKKHFEPKRLIDEFDQNISLILQEF